MHKLKSLRILTLYEYTKGYEALSMQVIMDNSVTSIYKLRKPKSLALLKFVSMYKIQAMLLYSRHTKIPSNIKIPINKDNIKTHISYLASHILSDYNLIKISSNSRG